MDMPESLSTDPQVLQQLDKACIYKTQYNLAEKLY